MAAFLVMLLAMPVAAQERPAVRPVHDVSVTYRLRGVDPNGRPESRQVHMSWTDQGRRMRLEMQGQSDFTLVDYETNRITMVMLQRELYLALPFDPRHPPGLDIPAGVGMTEAGTDVVANTRCVVWNLTGPLTGTACITQDGLPLRLRTTASGEAAMEAVSVAYGPQPQNLFTVPAGLHRIDPH
ncbi:MAG TPA: hypothetical protein VIZ17_03145 [Acetobacteraceae bacterium]